MASYLNDPNPKKRQRHQSEPGEPTKRRHISEAKVQKPLRNSVRLNIASGELSQQQQQQQQHPFVTKKPKQRKRSHEAFRSSASVPTEPYSKRLRLSADPAATKLADQETRIRGDIKTAIDHWRKVGFWPKQYFEPDTMSHLLLRKRSARSSGRKRSEPGSLAGSSITPSDQKPREEKSALYQNPRYKALLETKGSYMDKSQLDVTHKSKGLCRTLLEREQVTPDNTLFQDDVFDRACRKLQDKNEARVVQDVARLIVPSAETLATFGAKELEVLVESVNEGWSNSVPLTGTRPQPDYSVGFKREAFSEEQRGKLGPFIGDFIAGDQSYFMATYYMYFPFLTCEAKCGAAALDIADRQNAHSMTLAVRAVVELFRLVQREKEINREILAFSVSHDHRSVRIYGHYAVVDGPKTAFYRHPIRDFSFQELDGKEKWTTYKFTKSVYDMWMPTHFARLCSAIDELPSGVNFDVPPLQQDTGLSQDLSSNHLSESFMGSVIQTGDDNSQSGTPVTTPDTSFAQPGASKRQKGKKTS
ncbi:hypothetical protein BDV95DRAFT_216010 [Massariosphaeria phaeospora]|uniref:DUF7924 domain-containing protein n=1 Tax=Massariosphaeria phaeospora TaxID=100035 RepID=A0A7C8MCX8_9PLEO|nr:hypothetical protein BDV95DRAFT_216010 [Massariosphaeria phaeospora]